MKEIFINGENFFNKDEAEKEKKLCSMAYALLKDDPYSDLGIRRRSYKKYTYSKDGGLVSLVDTKYFQTYDSNNADGGWSSFKDI